MTVTGCAFGSITKGFGPNRAGNAGLNNKFLQFFQLSREDDMKTLQDIYRNVYGVSVTIL